MDIELGTLDKVKLRKKWENEASVFTPWLAQEKSLAMLGDALGLELEFEDTEVAVGPYSADILARDTGSGRYVVIENQLEKTDHRHLGQMIVYGAVLDASAVVWVAADFTDEHRKSLDWLNNNTGDDLNFYGVKIELWKIGDSIPAPRFNVVSRPAKVSTISPGRGDGELTPTRKLQLEFWTQLREKLLNTGVIPSLQKPHPQYWYDVAVGRSDFVLSNIANTTQNRIGVRLYLSHRVADQALALLEREREDIEKEIGENLTWNPNPDLRDKTIGLFHPANLSDKDAWPEYLDWMVKYIVKFRKAFYERIRSLDLIQATVESDESENNEGDMVEI
ncbi:DUF4268 domain-containing protein [Candidatus Sumerlaeota bacterium]